MQAPVFSRDDKRRNYADLFRSRVKSGGDWRAFALMCLTRWRLIGAEAGGVPFFTRRPAVYCYALNADKACSASHKRRHAFEKDIRGPCTI